MNEKSETPLSLYEIQRIIVDGNYNYVGFAVTNWHLIGAKVACAYLKNKGISIRPLFVIVGHPIQGYLNILPDGLDFCRLALNEKVDNRTYFKFVISFLLNKLDKSRKMYVGMPWHISNNLLFIASVWRNFTCLIFEEGAKSYNKKYHNVLYLWKNLKFAQFLNQTTAIFLQRIISKRGNLIDLHPLHRINSKLVINEETSALYKYVLEVKPLSLKNDTVLIVMQSLESEYMRVLKLIIPLLIQANKTIYIKEHPRFPLSKMDFEGVVLIKDNRSLEVLMPVIRAKYILSFFSTALITTKMFFDSVPISLYQLMDRDKLSIEVDDLLCWFKSAFGEIVKYPENSDELLKILNRYGDK